MSIRFQRGNFVVADLQKSLTFYRDVLGFSVEYILGHNPDSYSIPVFEIPEGAELGFAALNTPTQPRVMALTQVSNVALAPVPHPRRSAIVLDIDNPDAVMAGARALGLQVYDEEVLHTKDGRIGREIGRAHV